MLSSTVDFATFAGSNIYDPATGKYPWMDFHRNIARYFDLQAPNLGQPIKVVAISRGHLKTEVGCHAMARYALANPEKRCCIVGSIAERAEQNLSHIHDILRSAQTQTVFSDVLYDATDPRDHLGRAIGAYTMDSLLLRRHGAYRERTIEAMGRTARFAGKHYDGVIWLDDLVSEQDDFENNPKIADDILHILSHIIEFVAVPGAEIWLTFTRYHQADPYAQLLDPRMGFATSVVPEPIVLDCYSHDASTGGVVGPLFPYRFCLESKDQVADIEVEGKAYKGVRRRSLVEMEARMNPKEWYSQMLNRPLSGAGVGIDPKWMDSVLPCDGNTITAWLASMTELDSQEYRLTRACTDGMIVHILGDPSYRAGRLNDFAVLLVVGQTRTNHWIVLDGFREKLGFQGDIRYAKRAIDFKRQYNAIELAIEHHTRESLESVFWQVGREEGLEIHLRSLPDNTHKAKRDRIARLVPMLSEGRLHFCAGTDAVRLPLREEASQFPACCDGMHGMHDDCLDCLANGCQVFLPRNERCDENEADATPWVSRLPNRLRNLFPGRRRTARAF